LWIPDIFGWVRIRILGTVPLTYRYVSGSCFFRQWLRRCYCLCLLITFEGTFTLVFIDKIFLKSGKKVEIKVFIATFFACWWKDPDPYKIITDPDPQHWLLVRLSNFLLLIRNMHTE
jgi:hypothetical protein